MNEIIKRLLNESIALELNIGDLYQLFSVKFSQDYDFWWKLSIEEMNHAALIESINDVFLTENLLPSESIENQTKALQEMNLAIRKYIESCRLELMTRENAFRLAFEIENSIGESHFELLMTAQPNSTVMKIMQKLNGDDINHAKRMIKYARENGISVSN
jgi:ferritin